MGWWIDDPTELYWCEITDRDDLGADLKCPVANGTGRMTSSTVSGQVTSYSTTPRELDTRRSLACLSPGDPWNHDRLSGHLTVRLDGRNQRLAIRDRAGGFLSTVFAPLIPPPPR